MRKSMILLIGVIVMVLSTGSISTITMATDSNSGTDDSVVTDSESKDKKEVKHRCVEENRECRLEAKKESGEFDKSDFKKSGKKGGVHVSVITVAADVLDKTKDEVKEAIKEGKVGDLLVAEGKVDEFKTAYLAELQSKLDAAVEAGTLTQEQADEKYASGKEKMDAYDGTSHFCDGEDHSRMSGRKSKKIKR